jgi:hypothetical protein
VLLLMATWKTSLKPYALGLFFIILTVWFLELGPTIQRDLGAIVKVKP